MFKKGNKYGVKFTKENQPSGEAKSKGKQEARTMRETMHELLEAREIDERIADTIIKYRPEKKRDDITVKDVVCFRQIIEAKKGSVQAYKAICDTLGENAPQKIDITSGGMPTQPITLEVIDHRDQVDRNENTDDESI